MTTKEEQLEALVLQYRDKLRELLFQEGIPSNPFVTDDWILGSITELITSQREPVPDEGLPDSIAKPLATANRWSLGATRRYVKLVQNKLGLGTMVAAAEFVMEAVPKSGNRLVDRIVLTARIAEIPPKQIAATRDNASPIALQRAHHVHSILEEAPQDLRLKILDKAEIRYHQLQNSEKDVP